MLFTMAVSLCTSRIGKKTNSAIPYHTATSKIVVCTYGSAIERFYDKRGNGTEMVFFHILVRRKCMKCLINK